MVMRVEDVSHRLIAHLTDQFLNLSKVLRKLVIDQDHPFCSNPYTDVSTATADGVEAVLDLLDR